MRLRSLEVELFRAIQSARLVFGPGLNVVYGPNDLGKSTLTDAIRAALLIAPGSAEARSFATWGATAGQFPRVLICFECQGAIWQVEKVFGQGSRAKAYLRKSTDGGDRYHMHAQGRDVEGKLRELLNWGLAIPGGRGATQRAETYLTTALLGKQGDVSAIFDASLKHDQDETGRALVTRALDALGQDPVVTRLLDRLKEHSGEVYTAHGRHKRTADSPLVRAHAVLREREERLRDLQALAMQGKEIEEEVCRRLQARETALELRDQARAELEELRGYAASGAQRVQLERAIGQHLRDMDRITAAFDAHKAAKHEHLNAQAALTAVADEYEQAVQAASVADTEAQAARDRLSRARSAHESSEELASSARGARVSELRAQVEKAAARTGAARSALEAGAELVSLESQLDMARIVLADAEQEVARASAELKLASAMEELQAARVMTDAVAAADADQEKHRGRELAASAVVAEAEAALGVAAATLENAREVEKQSQRAAGERAMQLRLLDARILHCEATVREEREALDRARTTVLRMRRADEAQAAAHGAEVLATEIDASLAGNAAEIAGCEARLHALEGIGLELRRRVIASQVDELTGQEGRARDHRRRAAEVRDRAARLEEEVLRVRFPSTQHLSSLRTLHSEVKNRKAAGPAATPSAAALPLLAGAAVATIGFIAARYLGSAGLELSIGAALVLGIVATIVALANVSRQKKNAQRAWQVETGQLESQLAAEMPPVLREAGVDVLDEIESKRQENEKLHAEAGRLRQEAIDLDRHADSMFERVSALSSLRQELVALTGQLAARGDTLALQSEVLAGDGPAVSENSRREQERLQKARSARDALQTERFRQLALCASKRAQADSALAERGDLITSSLDVKAAVSDAEFRLGVAETQLISLRRDSERLTELPLEPAEGASQTALDEAKKAVSQANDRLQERRRKRQEVADDLARADARLELAREAAKSIGLREIEERVTKAQAAAGTDVEPPDTASARARHERAKEHVSSAGATVNLLAAGIPAARRKSEELQSTLASDAASEFASAEDEERRLYAALRDAEAEVPQTTHDVSASAQELRDAGQAAGRAEEELADMRERASAATAKRDGLKASAERAGGELEACERQTLGMNVEQAAGELAKARQALAELHPVPEVTPEQLGHAELALEDSDHVLKACEGSLNEVRGKLELVAGRVGLERIEEEQEAVQRAKEHAEDQELNYEASKHLLESLEAAETKRSSHLGRCLAVPVTERFLALTGDLYAHVNLDPDLRLEGFVAAGGEHRVDELSVGTREQLATIVRLAIAAQLKTAVLLDDQLVHSDSGRIEWFRKQVRNSVSEHGHQVIVITCRLSDYAVDDEILGHEGAPSADGSTLTIINILDVVRRVRAWPPAVLG
jgi:hypothetical protein